MLVEFKIDEIDLGKICKSRASLNNGVARDCGQQERLAPSDLAELYYKTGGLCSICTTHLTKENIQLDHIREVNRRSARVAFVAGGEQVFSPVASINNVQWVCKTCNSFKEFCRRSQVDMATYLRSVLDQCEAGFPIRSGVVITGRMEAKKQERKKFLRELFKTKGNLLTINEAMDLLQLTEFVCCEALLAKELRSIGWRGAKSRVAAKISAINDVVSKFSGPMKTKTDWFRLVKEKTRNSDECRMSFVRFCQIVEENGIDLPISNSAEMYRPVAASCRQPTSADKQAVLAEVRHSHVDGLTKEQIVLAIASMNRPESIVDMAIAELCEIGRLQPSKANPEKLVYGLDRREAAEMLGVSLNRLKKWATRNWDHCAQRPEFFKPYDKPKGRCFYAFDLFHQFVLERGKHQLDLGISGQRDECVAGGRLGGRPVGCA